MAKLSAGAKTIQREGSVHRVDAAYEIYLGLYQAITGPQERQKVYREFSPGFFDLIVIDECHRGSAAEDSAWREILEYFSSATQIGLTATPKETKCLARDPMGSDSGRRPLSVPTETSFSGFIQVGRNIVPGPASLVVDNKVGMVLAHRGMADPPVR